MDNIEFEVINFRPLKVSVYKPIIDKLEGLEEGQCVKVKSDSRHSHNKISAGVRGALRNKFRIITQREDGFLYIYRGEDFTHMTQVRKPAQGIHNSKRRARQAT